MLFKFFQVIERYEKYLNLFNEVNLILIFNFNKGGIIGNLKK